MEIINIEADTFEAMMTRFENFTTKIEELCFEKRDRRLKKWLDNQDVCQILNISKRTLQAYRDNGLIQFSQTNNKIFYKPEDIEKMIVNNRIRL